MYTIEYYATDRKMPKTVEKDKVQSEVWNIKSITIDTSDIYAIVNSSEAVSNLFYSLIARIGRNPKINKVTIYNCDFRNGSLIYDIITKEWLINKDNFEYSDALMRKLIEEAYEAIQSEKEYKESESYYQTKRYELKAKRKISKLRHYVAESKRFVNLNNKTEDEKTLKFGNNTSVMRNLNSKNID